MSSRDKKDKEDKEDYAATGRTVQMFTTVFACIFALIFIAIGVGVWLHHGEWLFAAISFPAGVLIAGGSLWYNSKVQKSTIMAQKIGQGWMNRTAYGLANRFGQRGYGYGSGPRISLSFGRFGRRRFRR